VRRSRALPFARWRRFARRVVQPRPGSAIGRRWTCSLELTWWSAAPATTPVNECLACGVPLIARACRASRSAVLAERREQAEACPASIDEAVSVVRACLARPGRTATRREFPNGAREAAEILEALGA